MSSAVAPLAQAPTRQGLAARAFLARHQFVLGCALAAGLLAAAIVAWSTAPRGPGMGLDSVAYLAAAQSLAEGRGLELPWAGALADASRGHMAHWAPGTSLVLAVPLVLGLAPVDAVRMVLGLAAFAFAALATFAVGRLERRAAPLVALLLLGTPPVWHLYTSLWSEALFLVVVVATVATLARRPDAHLAHGLLAAAGVLVRHAGISVALACATWAASRPVALRRRALGVLLATLPTVVVHVGLAMVARARGAAVRHYRFYGLDDGALESLWITMKRWLVPVATTDAVRDAACLAVLALVLVPLVRRARTMHDDASTPTDRFAGAALLVGACHLGFILAARVLADPWIPFSARLLAPTLVPVLIAGMLVAGSTLGRFRWATPALAATVLAYGIAGWRADVRSSTSLRRLVRDGLYLTDRSWCASPTVAWLAEHGGDAPVWSNWASVVALHAGREARDLPLAAKLDLALD